MASRRYEPDALLSQSRACDVLGISTRTLARRLADYRDNGADAGVPPFIIVGKERRWRYDYLVAFREKRTSLRGFQRDGYPSGAVAPSAEQPRAHTRLSVRAIVRMIEGWKVRELHRRYDAIFSASAKSSELLEAHLAERRLLYDEEGNRRPRDDAGVKEACRAKAQQIVQPEGTTYLPDELAPLMQTVWEHVLETEREWLLNRV